MPSKEIIMIYGGQWQRYDGVGRKAAMLIVLLLRSLQV